MGGACTGVYGAARGLTGVLISYADRFGEVSECCMALLSVYAHGHGSGDGGGGGDAVGGYVPTPICI